jgi:predicted DNA-binding transcriptional regulator YafY
LKGYRSGNSHEQKDRLVEPFSFTTDFISTWAYDVEAGSCKTFKNTRVASVQVLNETWAHADSHQEGYMDVFRISTDQQIPVRLKLSMRASELLKEEYPLSEQYIKSLNGNHFLFEAPVCSFDGVGRFILGLCHEVEILEPLELKNFLKERVEKNLFSPLVGESGL